MNRGSKNIVLNFGPQHPAAHGVLRLLVEASGERVIGVDPHVGFLHRGTEKLIEHKTYFQAIPYFDRLDYVSTLAQEHVYVLALEALCNVAVPYKVQFLRIIMDEVTRILNHIMCITTHALDVGSLTPFLWGFEERERLIFFYEYLTGARMHTAGYRLGGINCFPPISFFTSLLKFMDKFISYVDSLDDLLSYNPIWVNRLKGVGFVSRKVAIKHGFTGPVLRASGLPWDLRKINPYETYQKLEFDIPTAYASDSFSRYKIRLLEVRESCKIISSAIRYILASGGLKYHMRSLRTRKFNLFRSTKISMEELILSFKTNSSGIKVPRGSVYASVEAPKGETGVTLVSDGSARPWRCKVKAPGFLHLAGFSVLTKHCLIADLVGIIGSLDIVFGEIDR